MPKKTNISTEEQIKQSIDYYETFDDIVHWQHRFDRNMSELCDEINSNIECFKGSVDKISTIFDNAMALHEKDGCCYKITKRMFERYAEIAYINRVRKIAFSKAGFLDDGKEGESIEYSPQCLDSDTFLFSPADIYDLMDAADTGDYSSHAINGILHSVKLPLQGALVYFMDRACYIMTESDEATPETKVLGDFLKRRYFVLPSESDAFRDCMQRTGCKTKAEYYSKMEKALSLASAIIFGFAPELHDEKTGKKRTSIIEDTSRKISA